LNGGPRHKQKVSFQKKKTILKQKMQSLYLFKKWLTKKNLFLFVSWPSLQKGFFCQPFFEKILFVCVVALPSKRFFFVNHFLKRYFLFVSWPSLQKGFLLGKPSLYPFPAPFLGKGVKRGEKEGIQEKGWIEGIRR